MKNTRQVQPGARTGTAHIPASKSKAHRLLITAAFSDTPTVLECNGLSNDILATIDCLNALGCDIVTEDDCLIRVNPFMKAVSVSGIQDRSSETPGSGLPDRSSKAPGSGLPDEESYRILPCRDSGSTLRFILPLVGVLGVKACFEMEGRLPERPLAPYDEELEAHGMKLRREGNRLFCEDRLTPGSYTLPGNVTSQYITGLLMALPFLDGDSTLNVTGNIESADYIRITEDVLRLAGMRFSCNNISDRSGPDNLSDPDKLSNPVNLSDLNNMKDSWSLIYNIQGDQRSRLPNELTVESDWSGAAFFLCLGALSPAGVTVQGLNTASLQGDKAILDILKRFGADIHIVDAKTADDPAAGTHIADAATADDPPAGTQTPDNRPGRSPVADTDLLADITIRSAPLHGCTVDAASIPDLIPTVAVVASVASGTTHIINAGRLRLKESDRLKTTAQMLNSIGADVTEGEDSLTITGRSFLKGGLVDSHNDHRIAMAAAVAASVCEAGVEVTAPECVRKSFADFWEVFDDLSI